MSEREEDLVCSDDWLDEEDTTCCFGFEDDCEDAPDSDPPEEPALAPSQKIESNDLIAKTYNRIGLYMEARAKLYDVELAAILAVWRVECGPYAHVPGQAIIRFESHLLYRNWGKSNKKLYGAFFKHNPAKGWLDHQFRDSTAEDFSKLHVNQKREYAALRKATELAGQDTAYRCISIGGPQILCRNFALLGYDSPGAMYDAFQGTEDSHVRGFLNFCKAKGVIEALREHRWADFAKVYNGPGQPGVYGPKIAAAFDMATKLLATLR